MHMGFSSLLQYLSRKEWWLIKNIASICNDQHTAVRHHLSSDALGNKGQTGQDWFLMNPKLGCRKVFGHFRGRILEASDNS